MREQRLVLGRKCRQYPHPVEFIRVSRAHLSIAPLHILTTSRHAHHWGPKAGVGWNAADAQTGGRGMMPHSEWPGCTPHPACFAVPHWQRCSSRHSHTVHPLLVSAALRHAASWQLPVARHWQSLTCNTPSPHHQAVCNPCAQALTCARSHAYSATRDSRRAFSNSTGAADVSCPPRRTVRR